MILQALKEYYDRKAADPNSDIAPEGWELKEIPFIIVLDNEGNLIQIEDTREGEGKKKRAKAFLVPQGAKKTSGITANLLWDAAGYIFGTDKKGDEKKKAFLERLKSGLGDVEVVQIIVSFLENITEDRLSKEECWKEIFETNPNLSFQINTDTFLVCRHPDVVSKLSASTNEGTNDILGICLVTGNNTKISYILAARASYFQGLSRLSR